jgi:alpha-tubulin suppressor-like RCC1 family protein
MRDASQGSGGDSGDASQGRGGTAGVASGGTAGADSDGTAGADSGGTAGTDSSAGDSGPADAGDGGPCWPECPPDAPVCSAGACHKVKQIVTGAVHVCALIEDGTVRCWGDNGLGQLGDGSRIARPTPGAPLPGLTDVVGLAAGFVHTCAVTGTGSVWCWGENYYGQLGFTGVTTVPVEVQGLGESAKEVVCHGYSPYRTGQTCARMTSGRVKCWGSNVHGQLGTGTRGNSSATPVEVANLTDTLQIAMSTVSVCAVRTSRKVACWGYNGFNPQRGWLATGSTEEFIMSPEEVLGLSDVHMIDGGEGHFCAVAGPGRHVKCWGQDSRGELGDGPPHDGSESTTVVHALSDSAAEVRASCRSSCARLQNGDVLCWGQNVDGQLGNGNRTGTNAASTRTLLAAPAISIDDRWEFGCAILDTGRVQCWGRYPLILDAAAGVWDTPQYVVW